MDMAWFGCAYMVNRVGRARAHEQQCYRVQGRWRDQS